jgi:hypothetical protein
VADHARERAYVFSENLMVPWPFKPSGENALSKMKFYETMNSYSRLARSSNIASQINQLYAQ